MTIKSTPKHYAYAKKRADKLKKTDGEELAFCVVRLKGTKDVIIHFDAPGREAKFKNPALIKLMLMKTKVFGFAKSDPFFEDISGLVSLAGIATSSEGTVDFARTVPGKGKEDDLKIALRDIKIKKYTFSSGGRDLQKTDASEGAEAQKSVQALVEHFGTSTELLRRNPGPAALIENPLAAFGDVQAFSSVEELTAFVSEMWNFQPSSEEEKKVAYFLRTLFEHVYKSLEDWSEDGIEPIADAADFIGDIDDIEAAEAELLEQEEARHAELLEAAAEIETTLQDQLSEEAATGTGWVANWFREVVTLREGSYRLITKTKEEYGKKALLAVSKTNDFDMTVINELCAGDGRVVGGKFEKSASLRRIAFTGGRSRAPFREALTGLDLTPFLVDDLRWWAKPDLEAQKRMAYYEDHIAPQKAAFKFTVPPLKDALQHPVLSKEFYYFSHKNQGGENYGFLAQSGDYPSDFLLRQHKRMTNRGLYNAYIPKDAPLVLNLSNSAREEAERLKETSGYDAAVAADGLAADIKASLKDVYSRFRYEPEFLNTLYLEADLRAKFITKMPADLPALSTKD